MVLRVFLEVLAIWWSSSRWFYASGSSVLFPNTFPLNSSFALGHKALHILFFFFPWAVFSLATLLNNSLQVSITVKPSYQTHFVPTKWTLFLHCFVLATDDSLHIIWQWMALQVVVLPFQTFSQYELLPTYELKH